MKNFPVGTKFYRNGKLRWIMEKPTKEGGKFISAVNGGMCEFDTADPLYDSLYPQNDDYYTVEYPKSLTFNSLYEKLS